MIAAWPTGAPNNGGAIVDPSKRFIKWNQKCSTVQSSWQNGANMSFVINFQLSTNQQLSDATSFKNFFFNLPDLLVDGHNFNDYGNNYDGACYLGVFPSVGVQD